MELKEIYIEKEIVRIRGGGGDMTKWLSSINSVMTYRTLKAEVKRGMRWEPCMVSAKVDYRDLKHVEMNLIYENGLMLTRIGPRSAFLPADYVIAKREEYRARKKAGHGRPKAEPSLLL